MHSLMIISAGLAALLVMVLAAPVVGAKRAAAARLFIPLWLAASLVNMWVGVSRAGYTVLQELPILLVVFGLPAAIAWLLSRRLERA